MQGKVTISSALILLVILLTAGTLVYHHLEKWSYVDSLYFSTTTLTTIGYGDLHPTSSESRLFTVFYIMGGVSTGFIALMAVAKHFFENKYSSTYLNTTRMIEAKVNKRFRRWKV
jgi:voltage-gated potassium channel Kch